MKDKLPVRKNHRLPKHNYAMPGSYFITICTDKRKNILSRIVGAGSARPKAFTTDLSPFGKIVNDVILDIPKKFEDLSVDYCVIMPNHVHLILSKASRFGRVDPAPTVETNLLDAVAWLKFISAKRINGSIENSLVIWQRSFYDHVIRNEQDYYEIAKYIVENPLAWEEDTLYMAD